MTFSGWGMSLPFTMLVIALAKPVGLRMHRLYAGDKMPLTCVLGPVEQGFYKLAGVNPKAEQSWVGYAVALMLFAGLGIRKVMITGDNPLTAASITAESGVGYFLAEATPEDKLALMHSERKLEPRGRTATVRVSLHSTFRHPDERADRPSRIASKVVKLSRGATIGPRISC